MTGVLNAKVINAPKDYIGIYHGIETVVFKNDVKVPKSQEYMNEDLFIIDSDIMFFQRKAWPIENIVFENEEGIEWVKFKFEGLVRTFDITHIGGDTYILRLFFEANNVKDYVVYRLVKRPIEE
jgi:hypothetical protein